MNTPLPDWLFLWIAKALVGEIYPEIRAVVAGFDEQNSLTLRFYLDRVPEPSDSDSADEILTNILANTSSASEISNTIIECLFSDEKLGNIGTLGGMVFARREY